MLVIGLGLTSLSIYLLRLDIFVASLSLITVFMTSIGITSLAMGLGAIYPTFNVENPMQLTTGIGAVLTVILSMLYIGATIMVVAYPMHEYFSRNANSVAVDSAMLIGPAISLIILTALATFFPVKFGLRRLLQKSE